MKFNVHDDVKIMSGKFKGCVGTIVEIDYETKKLKIHISGIFNEKIEIKTVTMLEKNVRHNYAKY